MANTGNTQQQINYGAAANDGQGDPLRTAFIKTDDNFDAIWNTGPVGSNITIVNNTIQSNNVNGNIVLRPNGVGVIQANAAIIPNATDLRDLGTADLRFRAAYIGTGGLSVTGDVTVTGNLTAGNIAYTGNVFVGDLQGSVFADDSTIMVDAVDNEMFAAAATFGRANITGNISADYFIGDGSLLTGLPASYSDANVATFLADFGSNNITTTGDISAGNIDTGIITLTNGAQIRDTAGAAVAFGVDAGANTQGIEAIAIGLGAGRDAQGNNAIAIGEQAGQLTQGIEAIAIGRGAGANTQGNRAVAISIGAGSTGQGEDAIAIGYNAGTTGQTEAAVAIGRLAGQTSQSGGAVAIGSQAGADTQSVSAVAIGSQAGENSQGQYAVAIGDLAGATSQGFAAVAIGALAGRTSQGNNSIIINATDANLNQTTANTFTVAPVRNDVANVANVMFYNVTSKEITYGNTISVAGNITANYFIGDGSQLTNLPTVPGNLIENGDSNVTIASPNGNITVSANTQIWTFGTDGNLTLPGNTVTSTLYTDNNGYRLNLEGNNSGVTTAKLVLDNDSGFIRLVVGNVSTPAIWAFRDNGNLTVAGNINFGGDSSAAPSLNDFFSVTSAANFAVTIDSANSAPTWSFAAGDSDLGEFDELPLLRTPAGNGSVIYNETLMAILAGNIDAGERSSVRLQEGAVALLGTTSLDGELSTIILEVNTGGVGIRALGDAAPRLSVVGNISGGNILTGGSISATGNLTANNISTGNVLATRLQNDGNLEIRTDVSDTARTFEFGADGRLILPESSEANVAKLTSPPNDANVSLQLYSGNAVRIVSNTVGEPFVWTFGTTGAFTAPGNITGGNIITNGSVNTGGNINFTGAEASDTARIFADVAGSNTSMVLEVGDDDADAVVLRHYSFAAGNTIDMLRAQRSSNTEANVTVTGNFTATGNITGNTAGFAIGYRDIPQVAFTGNATMAAADAGKHFYSTESTDYILTIADNSAVSWPVGTAITVVNRGTGNITVAQASGVSLYLAGNSTAGNRTVSTYGMATVLNVAANVWMINGTGVL